MEALLLGDCTDDVERVEAWSLQPGDELGDGQIVWFAMRDAQSGQVTVTTDRSRRATLDRLAKVPLSRRVMWPNEPKPGGSLRRAIAGGSPRRRLTLLLVRRSGKQ